jgi:uncharacterized phosphosugar-binding protein
MGMFEIDSGFNPVPVEMHQGTLRACGSRIVSMKNIHAVQPGRRRYPDAL